MLFGAFKLLLSLVIGNWVYSEVVMLVPQFEGLARSFYQNVRIPTHNEWSEVLSEGSVVRMEREIAPASAAVLPKSLEGYSVFGQDVRNLWRGWSFSRWWGSVSSQENINFLTGEAIFVSPGESFRLFHIREAKRLPSIKPRNL